MTDTNGALGWDTQTVEDPGGDGGSYTLLEPGEYSFTIAEMKRAQHNGSAKIGPCPKAIVTVQVDAGGGETVNVYHNLFLHTNCTGLLAQFFAGIGLHEHGEPLRLDWSRIVGCRGRCKLGHWHSKEKDQKYNDIKQFLDPPEQPAQNRGLLVPKSESEEIPF